MGLIPHLACSELRAEALKSDDCLVFTRTSMFPDAPPEMSFLSFLRLFSPPSNRDGHPAPTGVPGASVCPFTETSRLTWYPRHVVPLSTKHEASSVLFLTVHE